MRSADRLLEQLRARGGVVEGSSKDLARELGCGTDRSLRTALMDLETRGLARRATRPGQRVLRLEVANLGTSEGHDSGSSEPRKDKPGKSEATSEGTSEVVARSSSKDSKRNEVEGAAAAAAARPRKVGSDLGSSEGDAPAWRVVESTLADLRAERARVDALQRESLELAAELLEAREEIATLRAERGRVSPENEVSPCTVSSPTPRPVATAPEPARSATASSGALSPCAAPAATPTRISSSTAVAPPVVAREATSAEIREAAEEELLLARRRGKKVDFPEPWLKPKVEEMQHDHERVFDVLARKKDRIAQDAREAEAIKKRGEENAKTRAALGIDESVLAKIREEAREAEVKRVREALAS